MLENTSIIIIYFTKLKRVLIPTLDDYDRRT